MTNIEQKKAAIEFAEFWKGKGYEKGESQTFWLSLLNKVLGVENPQEYIVFEEQVLLDHTSFIDGYILPTHVIIEQKSVNKNLDAPIKQSDGTFLTPFQQAKRYSAELPYTRRPRWIVTSNFQEFRIYDMQKPADEPETILLADLPKEYYRLRFLIDSDNEDIQKEKEISIQAGDLVGTIYDLLLNQYIDPENPETLKSLNMLCVRIVFCLYAEDAGIFGDRNKFHDYIRNTSVKKLRRAMQDLFKILDTKLEERDPYLDDDLAGFPYVNGGLFSDENIIIPQFTEEIRDVLLNKASKDFDWSGISPTIFGALFESTLNPETRHDGGMHYTSIENIHKVIDPLFLDSLKNDLKEIKKIKVEKTRKEKLKSFRDYLSTLTFMDPACGSGNFLTETYISLRRLENEAIEAESGGQIYLDTGDIIKVSIQQFYGIEINDFAVTVAKTAMWIAESQMLKETEQVVNCNLNFLPLKSYANIVEGNAIRVDWDTVIPHQKLTYLMGNPPFIGARKKSEEQKSDIDFIFGKNWNNSGNLDYVACWYKKAVEYIKTTNIKAAFVSTNSITQGEQVAALWEALFKESIHFDFAYRTFIWDSEANVKAHVHCVIIGFSVGNNTNKKLLFDESNRLHLVDNINAYLIAAPDIFINNRRNPICDVSKMSFGSMPNDEGYLSKYSTDEKDKIVALYPEAEHLFKRIVGSEEFINGIERWCIWLDGVSPAEYRKIPPIMKAIAEVQKFRSNSSRKATRKLADTPMLFGEIRHPSTDYLLVPSTSSQNRKYVPIGFLNKNIISNNANLVVPNATLYEFGIMTSKVHNAWMRAVCGRMKSDYRYSATIVYNNFPWPTPTTEQKEKIEESAQKILDIRAKYSDCSLADLYDALSMPNELRTAHEENDKNVMKAYGFGGKIKTESECVAELMKMYKKKIE